VQAHLGCRDQPWHEETSKTESCFTACQNSGLHVLSLKELKSCADTDEGITGYYDIDTSKTYENTLTVTYDGLPLTAKYHDYRFAAYDNVGVLVPRHDYRKTTLVYMAAAITSKRWRYSYGRKCYKSKLTNLKIVVPVTGNNVINEDVIEQLVKSTAYSSFVLT
jgi:hypothetical protein